MDKIEKALELIKTAVIEIDQELARCRSGSGAMATLEDQLALAREELLKMETAISNGSLPPREERDRFLGHMIVDSWPINSSPRGVVLSALGAFERL